MMQKSGKLHRIKLKGFRSIRQLDLTLKPLNVLIGANGSGKSNFINFFTFMHRLMTGNLALYIATKLNGAERTLYFGRKVTDALHINLHLDNGEYAAALRPTNDDRLVFDLEALKVIESKEDLAPPLHFIVKEQGRSESGFTSTDTPLPTPVQLIKNCLNDWLVYHFHDTSETAKVKGTYSIHANDRLMTHGENLASFLYKLKNTSSYTQIVRTIQRVAPFFHDFHFQIEPNDVIRLRWKHKGCIEDYFDASMLSDGTLRFICLTTLLLQPQLPSLILLDEPELGLHPFAIQLLAGMLRSASESTQIITSTQSITLANQFSWSDLVIVDQVGNESQFSRLEESKVATWLEHYKMGDLWEMNLLGGTPE